MDRTAPEVSIQEPAPTASVKGTVHILGMASDDREVGSVEVQVDQGPFVPASGTAEWSHPWDTLELGDGFHTLTVRATDTAGNVGLTAVTVWVGNAVSDAPIAMRLSLPVNNAVIGDTLRASATFTNMGTRAVRLPRLFLTARPPGGTLSGGPVVDFEPELGPLTLNPGETVRLEAFARTRPFDTAGPWWVLPSYEDEASARHFGPVQSVPLLRQVRLGAAIHNRRLFDTNEPKYQETFLANFDSFTPEFELKIAQLQPVRGQFDFSVADQLVGFAEANGKQLRGHTLIWGKSLPAWLTERTWTREELIEVMETHIATVVGRYRGRIPVWDVVNEAIEDDGSWSDNLWLRTIGPEYVALAFQAAHRADPSARLFYNDFGAERVNAKSTAIYDMAVALKAQGVPIDGIGMQAHVTPNYYPTQAQLEIVLGRLDAAGLESELTEIDVDLGKVAGNSEAEKFKLQADIYRGMVAACLARPGCTRVTTWGVTDKYSHLGSAGMPLLFNAQYQPKPAMGVIRTLLGR